jgi:hypothetical protein
MTIFSLARRRRLLTAAATLPLVVGLLVTGSSTASASSCWQPAWTDKDKSGSGTVTNAPTAMHIGPEGGCQVIEEIYPGATLWYHCFVINSAGHSWTNVRISGSNISGWIYDAYLNDGGSNYFC